MNELFYPHYDAYSTLFDSQLNYWTPEHTNSYFHVYMKRQKNTKANQNHKPVFAKWSIFEHTQYQFIIYLPIKLIKPLGITNLSVFFSGEPLYI